MTGWLGQSINNYKIIAMIGQTSLTTVYRALHKNDQREVAVKMIRPEAFSAQHFDELRRRFNKSVSAHFSLSHPHILNLLDYGIHKGSPYLVMDYIAGGTLKNRIGAPMPWYKAARLLAPIARALEYAHANKVVHGDVKPGNILIRESGIPMLSDFGMVSLLTAESASALESSSMGIGTPDYMAPELLSAQAQPQSDIYSLGIVFFELVTAAVPFHASTPAVTLLKHVDDPLPDPRVLNSALPDEVVDVLESALAKQPSERYATMGDFASALEKLAQSAPPPSIHLPDRVRSRKTARSVMLALIALFALAAVVYLASKFRLPPVAIQSPSPTANITATSISMTATTPPLAGGEADMPDIPGTRVIYDQDFDIPSPPDWVMKVNSAVMDGSLRIVGQGNWQDLSQATRLVSLRQGEAALVLFRYKSGASFDLYLRSSTRLEDGTVAALEWGISVLSDGVFRTHAYQGGTNIGTERWEGSLVPQPGPTYALLLRVGEKEEFITRLWDVQRPDLYLEMNKTMPSSWSGLGWDFNARAYNGMLNLDHYQEIDFD